MMLGAQASQVFVDETQLGMLGYWLNMVDLGGGPLAVRVFTAWIVAEFDTAQLPVSAAAAHGGGG